MPDAIVRAFIMYVTKNKKYSLSTLVDDLSALEFDNEIIKLADYVFEYSNASVRVSGFVYGTFSYFDGDYTTPPSYSFDGFITDVHGVVVDYADKSYTYTIEEIINLEKRLKYE